MRCGEKEAAVEWRRGVRSANNLMERGNSARHALAAPLGRALHRSSAAAAARIAAASGVRDALRIEMHQACIFSVQVCSEGGPAASAKGRQW